jgi:hypothetical protein
MIFDPDPGCQGGRSARVGLLKELLLLEMVLLMLLCLSTLLIEYAHDSRGYFVMDNSLVIFDINAKFLVSFSISKYCQNKHIRQCRCCSA